MTSAYIHGTAPEEQRRLGLMNEILNDRSLAELALRGGEKILEVGAGLCTFARRMAKAASTRVVAIERSEEQIRRAIELAREDGEEHSIQLRQGDALALDLGGEAGTFDLVHARFLLEHLSDPDRAVKEMIRAAKPGGRIVIEDDDHDVMRLWPEPPGFRDLWRAYMRSYERIGNDPWTGRRLVQFLARNGARPVRATWVPFGGCRGESIFPTLVDNLEGVIVSARDMILGESLYDAAYFDDTIAAYRRWSEREDAAIWYAMAWAEGRKP
jgi:ubiquinone/menaquinone biosynthesis C-methylase UbiE